jgi:hypothetical protein
MLSKFVDIPNEFGVFRWRVFLFRLRLRCQNSAQASKGEMPYCLDREESRGPQRSEPSLPQVLKPLEFEIRNYCAI